jgi:Carboxypeptidase regulatory-like domain
MIVTPLLLSLFLAGQVTTWTTSPQQPPRDTSAPAAKGTGSIKGKVVAAESGRPMRRVQINLSSPDLSESRSMSTTAQGTYEFKDLPPGRYMISASRAGFIRLQYGQRRPGEAGRPLQLADRQGVANADFSLPRTSSISGRVTDEIGDPLPEVSIMPAQWKYFRGRRQLVRVSGGATFNQTDDTGQFRISGLEPGDYFVIAHTRTTWTIDGKPPTERIGFLPTYYPGTGKQPEAQRIKVPLAQEVVIGDFAMVPGRVATISGTATTSTGVPLAGESVNRNQNFDSPSGSTSFGMPGAKVNPDGSFLIKDVTPGEYRLSIRSPADKDRPAEGVTVTVNVLGEDVAGVMLVTTAGGSMAGRIISDTGEPLTMPDTRMQVSARPVDPSTTFTTFETDNGRVRDDWTFDLTGLFGANRISVSPMPRGWIVRSIHYEGRDLADVPVEVTGGQRLEGVTVTLSKTLPALRGTLLDERNQPIEGTVLLYPEESQKWSEQSRLTRTARPDASGLFEFRNVIPGAYLAVALEYVREGEWTDPEFLESLRDRAKRVRVEDAGASPLALILKKQP